MFSAFVEAVRFLTLIPLPFRSSTGGNAERTSEQTIAGAMMWFPLVGALIGLAGCSVGFVAGQLWSVPARAVLVVVTMGIVTGGLHLDGLSDTFDAVMSWRSRERKLEIMKDSRIGAMGALALVAVIVLKIVFITTAGTTWWRAVLLAATFGRWADLYGIFRFPAARDGGLGRHFRDYIRPRDAIIATVQALVIGALVLLVGQPWPVWPLVLGRGVIAIGLLLAVTHGLCTWWTRSLGGLTGDTYGALSEIGEVVVLAAMSAALTSA